MNIEENIKPLKILMSKYKQIDEMNNFDHELALVIDYTELLAIETLLTAYEKEKEKNKEENRKDNNYLYFNDSADYEVALWEVIRTLRPDLAEKWDNGECADLKYIKEE